mgnify:CR=1 FL=1
MHEKNNILCVGIRLSFGYRSKVHFQAPSTRTGEEEMSRKSVRITPLGYIVLSIIILVMLVGIYFIVWSMRGSSDDNENIDLNNSDAVSSITPTPSLAPVEDQTEDPVEVTATTPDVTTAPTDAQTMTPKADDTPEPSVKTPSPDQVASAADGTLNASGVVLRQGPSASYSILGKYSSGTQLKIYEEDGDYYFVKVVKENLYGYMAVKFVDKEGLLPGETASPTPEAASGTISGTVSASVVALRSVPSTEDNTPIGEIEKGTAVWIYFETNDFYYIEVVETGVKCYAVAKYITASGTVPEGTPVP